MGLSLTSGSYHRQHRLPRRGGPRAQKERRVQRWVDDPATRARAPPVAHRPVAQATTPASISITVTRTRYNYD